jgi:tripartite-type tricarboxylate transporter receptor subunit TctC
VQSDLANAGWEVVGSSPEEFARFIASEQERWGRIVERTGIKIEE